MAPAATVPPTNTKTPAANKPAKHVSSKAKYPMQNTPPAPNRPGPPPPPVATTNTSTTRRPTTPIGPALYAHRVVRAKEKPPLLRCPHCLGGGPFLRPNATFVACSKNVCTTPPALVSPTPLWKTNISPPTTQKKISPNDPTTVLVQDAMLTMGFATSHAFAIRAKTITVVRDWINVRNAPTPPPIGG